MSLCAFLRKAFFLEGDEPVLESSTVFKRLLAIGMLGALAFLLSPEPTLGQTALKEKPPGYNHRFPPLPDKIQRLDAYRQRRERSGLLSKFVFWAAETGAYEDEGAMIIDMPSQGPVKGLFSSKPTVVHSGSVTVVEKPTLMVTPSEPPSDQPPKQVLRDLPSKRTTDANVKQASATKSNKNELVHELVVPSATDPSLPPLPEQVKAATRKPKVPMLRRMPEFPNTSVDDAIQQVDNVEKTPPHDMPAVRGVQQAVAMEALVEPKSEDEPELKPIVVTPPQKSTPVQAGKPRTIVSPTPAKSSAPRKLPNIVEEKKKSTVSTKPKTISKPVAKPTPKVASKTPPSPPAPRAIVAGERPTTSGSTYRHPPMVRSDIKQTGGTTASKTAVAAAASLKSEATTPKETNEPTPRNLPELETSKDLPPLPTEAEVAENQRKFEEALRKASKKSKEPTVEQRDSELTLPTEPLHEEPAAPPVQLADEPSTPAVAEPIAAEPAPVVTMEPTTMAPAENSELQESVPPVEIAAPSSAIEMPAGPEASTEMSPEPEPVVQDAPLPVEPQSIHVPAPSEQPENPPVVVMEAPAAPVEETAPPAMSPEEAIARLEASLPTEPVATSSVPPAVPSEPVPAMTGSPMPSIPSSKTVISKPSMDPALAEAQLELESMVHGVKTPSNSVTNLQSAQDELEALVQGRPIPKTISRNMPKATAEELLDAESELADLARQKGTRPVPGKGSIPPTLPSSMNKPTQVVPKATSSTTPKQSTKSVVSQAKKEAPKSVTESKPIPDSVKPPSPSPPLAKGEPTPSASSAKETSVVDSMKDKLPTLPDLPAQVEAPLTKRSPEEILMPEKSVGENKSSTVVASDRPPLKTTDVTKLAEEIKKSKKVSPNPSSLANTAKGTKDSGTSSSASTSSAKFAKPSPKTEIAAEAPKKEKLAAAPMIKTNEIAKKTPGTVEKPSLPTAPVKPNAEPKIAKAVQPTAPPKADPKNVATKPLPIEEGAPTLSPLPNSTEVSKSESKAKHAANPSTAVSSLPPKIDPIAPQDVVVKDGSETRADKLKNPTAPLSGGLTFGLQAIEQGLLDATKPSKDLASTGDAKPQSKPSARFNVAKLESFDDPTAKSLPKPASLGRPKGTPGLNPKDAIPLVPEEEAVIEDPTNPTPFNGDHAARMIKSIKESPNCQVPLRDLTQMEYWYRAAGAVEAVSHVARNNSDVALRIQATRLLGTVPLTMSEATNSLKALVKEATEPNVRETAEALLSERLASVPRSALR
ncbi:hypothetical protein K2Y11_00880 [bacterium]|nr:hypothetical protein [bacterium]